MPGMLYIGEGGQGNRMRIIRVREEDGWLYMASEEWGNTVDWYNPARGVPDLADPATLGCITHLIAKTYALPGGRSAA